MAVEFKDFARALLTFGEEAELVNLELQLPKDKIGAAIQPYLDLMDSRQRQIRNRGYQTSDGMWHSERNGS